MSASTILRSLWFLATHLSKYLSPWVGHTHTMGSPEADCFTPGCAHAQQVIWQLFNAIDKGFSASGDNDTEFLNGV